eukprot:gene1817-1847_t
MMASPQSSVAHGVPLIAGCYLVEIGQVLAEFGGGQPCFGVTDQRHSRRDLMAVQSASHAPARTLPINTLANTTIENMLLPLGHGRAQVAGGLHASFTVTTRPQGPSLASSMTGPETAWSERALVDGALRPIVSALEHLHGMGVTHRGIRPNNVFSAQDGTRLTLGFAWGAPAAMAQPCVFEPPYSAMCHPNGRGDGVPGDDIYALGVLLITLATGVIPMAGLDDETVIRRKLELGSYSALIGGNRISSTIADLVRGMLAEDPEHRPPAGLLADPFAARSRRLGLRPPQRAQRPIELGGLTAWDARSLAWAMFRAPKAAIRLMRSPLIDSWLRRTLGEPVLAARIDEIVHGADDKKINDPVKADAITLMRAIAALDPLAPLCWQGLTLFADGVGPLLAHLTGGSTPEGDLAKLEVVLADDMVAAWGEARPGRADLPVLRLDSRQYRVVLKTAGWAGGVKRLAYTLNPLLCCRSPKIASEAVSRLPDLGPALERNAAGMVDFVIDHDIAAFVAARFNGRIDSDLTILAQQEDADIDPPGHRGLAQLRILGRLCEQHAGQAWPALAALALRTVQPALSEWKSRTGRGERERALAAAVEEGAIATMIVILQDTASRKSDAQGVQAALSELRQIEAEIEDLAATVGFRSDDARQTGQEVAAAFGVMALSGAIPKLVGQMTRSGVFRWSQRLVAGIAVIAAPPFAALAALLLLPAAMAWIADQSPGRPAARAVMMFGLAASCHPFELLWRSGIRMDVTLTLVSELRVLSLAWAAQAGGWLLSQILPILLRAWREGQTRMHLAQLERRKKTLSDEWLEDNWSEEKA